MFIDDVSVVTVLPVTIRSPVMVVVPEMVPPEELNLVFAAAKAAFAAVNEATVSV